jgi:pyroglutamyl-peptidase
MNMPKILITGFEPFREVTTNPSQIVVEHLAKQNNPDLITEVLPVVYRKAEERIKALLHEHQPDAVIMLGVAQKREEINLERIAVNLDDATIPDNNGRPMRGTRIFDDAPVGYWSTLPLESMHAAITQAEIPVKFSNHAGTFLCNHVFYIARHTLEIAGRGSIPCGFIHLPSMEALPIETQIQAIERCLELIFELQTHQEPKEIDLSKVLINLKQAHELISNTEEDILRAFLEVSRYKVLQEITTFDGDESNLPQSPFDMVFFVSVIKRVFSNQVAIQAILDGVGTRNWTVYSLGG